MLRFLRENRDALVARWLEVLRRSSSLHAAMTEVELVDSFDLVLDEAIGALQGEVHPPASGSAIARRHGGQRHTFRLNVEALVREYRLFLETVIATASEMRVTFVPGDVLLLSGFLGAATEQAVAEYVARRDEELLRSHAEHFAFIAHELRNPLGSVGVAWALIRGSGDVGGKHAQVLERNFRRVSALIDEFLCEARLRSSPPGPIVSGERVDVAALIREAVSESESDAAAKGVRLESHTTPGLAVGGDRRLLGSALSNVVRNGVKFTRAEGHVVVTASLREGRVLVTVADECGGLPPGRAEHLFGAFEQAGSDRSGFGLGLAIARQAVEAHGGMISVQDASPKGCVFLIELPCADGVAAGPA